MHPRRVEGVSVQEIDDEIIVLDREQGKVHQLNRTASFIWRRCDGRTDVAGIVAAAAQAFAAPRADLERDVTAALRQMRELRLIEWDEADGEGTR